MAVGRAAEIFAWRENQVLKLYQGWMPASDADHESGRLSSFETGFRGRPAALAAGGRGGAAGGRAS